MMSAGLGHLPRLLSPAWGLGQTPQPPTPNVLMPGNWWCSWEREVGRAYHLPFRPGETNSKGCLNLANSPKGVRSRLWDRRCLQLTVKNFSLFCRMQRSPPSNCATSWIKLWLNVSTFLQLWLQLATSRFPAWPWEHRAHHWPRPSESPGLCPRPAARLSVWPWPRAISASSGGCKNAGAAPAPKVCFTGRVLWQGAYGLLSQRLLLGIGCWEDGRIWLMLDNNQEKVLVLLQYWTAQDSKSSPAQWSGVSLRRRNSGLLFLWSDSELGSVSFSFPLNSAWEISAWRSQSLFNFQSEILAR